MGDRQTRKFPVHALGGSPTVSHAAIPGLAAPVVLCRVPWAVRDREKAHVSGVNAWRGPYACIRPHLAIQSPH